MADDFIPYKAETSSPDFVPYTPAASATPKSAPQASQPRENPFAMIGEGEEVGAAGNAAAAPSVVPMFAAEGGSMLGGPALGATAYAATKTAMNPEEVKAHPYRTAAETAGIAAGPYVVGKATEYLAPTFSKLARGAGEVYDYLKTPLVSGAREAEAAAPAIVRAAAPPASPTPGPPLTNRQVAGKIVSTVKQAAGTSDQTPIFNRNAPPAAVPKPFARPAPVRVPETIPAAGGPVQGTVGAKTVIEQPNPEIAGPRIQTPARSETLTEAMKNRVEGSNPIERNVPLKEQPPSPARTPAQPTEETVPKLVRQSIHVNGARVTQAALHEDPGVLRDMVDLEGEQLREVLRKSGEDMTHIQTVGKSPGATAGIAPGSKRIAVDPNNISREEAMEILMEKGYTPEQILKEAPPRSKPAPHRTLYDTPEELQKYQEYRKKVNAEK